jgi:uncharacterized repeat protein (TIGR03803 family)
MRLLYVFFLIGQLFIVSSSSGQSQFLGLNIQNNTLFVSDSDGTNVVTGYSFNTNANGINPSGQLMQASNGKLYGVTFNGGTDNVGVLFEYDPTTNKYTKKVDLRSIQSYGGGSLMQASNGKIYGVSPGSLNEHDYGTIYEFDPASDLPEKKYSFQLLDQSGMPAANKPTSRLIEGASGKLYGTSFSSGLYSQGSLFEYDIESNSIKTVFHFGTSDNSDTFFAVGRFPVGNLCLASDGMIYGLTNGGGMQGKGVLFQYNINTGSVETRGFFDGTNGASPLGNSLIQASNGKIYGTTTNGGSDNGGVIFEFDLTTQQLTKKADFSSTIGKLPESVLTEANDGFLYGVSTSGGANGFGTIFKFNIATGELKKTFDFETGGNPDAPFYINVNNGLLLVLSSRASQTISFDPMPDKVVSDEPFLLQATSSSGLPVAYKSSDVTVASIEENKVTINNIGTTTITASQIGNFAFDAAPDVQQTLTIKEIETITGQASNPNNILEIYPNPISDCLDISFTGVGNKVVEIFHSDGKKYFSQEYHSEDAHIIMKGLPTGIYIVKVIQDNQLTVRRIIKE